MFSFVPSGLAEWQRSLLPDFFSSSWSVDNKLAAELCSRWQCQKDKLTCRYFVAVLFIDSENFKINIKSTFFGLLRWPRLPVETSSPLEFGATPVNESKVGNTLTLLNLFYLPAALIKGCVLFVLGKDVHSEESVLFSGVCRDPYSLLVPRSPGGAGTPLQMVCPCLFWVFFACVNLPAASANRRPVSIRRFNISPLSLNISTSEFTLLASPPKVTSYFCALHPLPTPHPS